MSTTAYGFFYLAGSIDRELVKKAKTELKMISNSFNFNLNFVPDVSSNCKAQILEYKDNHGIFFEITDSFNDDCAENYFFPDSDFSDRVNDLQKFFEKSFRINAIDSAEFTLNHLFGKPDYEENICVNDLAKMIIGHFVSTQYLIPILKFHINKPKK